MKVQFLKDSIGYYNIEYKKNSIHDLDPYTHYYRNWSKNSNNTFTITEKDNSNYNKNALIICYGHGSFDYFIIDEDIKLLNE